MEGLRDLQSDEQEEQEERTGGMKHGEPALLAPAQLAAGQGGEQGRHPVDPEQEVHDRSRSHRLVVPQRVDENAGRGERRREPGTPISAPPAATLRSGRRRVSA